MLRELDTFMSEAKLVASPLKLGDWLVESFGAEIMEARRARERLTPMPSLAAPPVTHASPSVPADPVLAAPHRASSKPPPSPMATTGDMLTVPRSPLATTDMDPPSYPAQTVDVVPSSARLIHTSDVAPPAPRGRNWALVASLLLIGVAVAIALVVLAGTHH
jgi:hypothetical protein